MTIAVIVSIVVASLFLLVVTDRDLVNPPKSFATRMRRWLPRNPGVMLWGIGAPLFYFLKYEEACTF